VSSSAPQGETAVATRSARTGLKAALAAAGAVGLLSSGVAFATTGHVPFADTIKSVTRHVTGQDDDTNASDHGKGPKGDQTTKAGDTTSPNGPNAASLQGACHAYAKGQKATHGHALEQRPFTALVAAAGGPDQVADFCATLPAKAHQGDVAPTHPTHPTTGPSEGPSTHPTHPTKPAHPSKPTQASSSHKPKPSHPTKKPHHTQSTGKPTDKPSHTHNPHRSPSAS
jgi:hypothetical protein